jgi:hypothetical protein
MQAKHPIPTHKTTHNVTPNARGHSDPAANRGP